MQNLFLKEEFTEKDILSVIENELEESIHLDFKDAASLGKSDNQRKEISKDVASFANSDGGLIIYGIKENDHKAHSLSFVNGNEFTKEWLEQIINTNIQRHIPELIIFPVRFDSSSEKTVYIVKIPRSIEAPHMSKDKRFYKRFNFESVMMEEYEVRQLYGRKSKSKLEIGGYVITLLDDDPEEDTRKLKIVASIVNDGDIPESSYKLNLYFNNLDSNTTLSWDPSEGNYSYTRYEDSRVKISSMQNTTIYPTEFVDMIRVTITIKKKTLFETLKNLNFEIKLFYSSGEDELSGNFTNTLKVLNT